MEYGLLSSGEYSWNSSTVLSFFLVSFTAVAVNVYFMLSGYFHSRFRVSKLIELVIEATVYTTVGYIISCIAGYETFGLKTLCIRGLFGCVSYWFLTVYIIIYCFSNYINKFLSSLSGLELKRLILAYFAVNTLFGFVLDRSNYGSAFSVLAMLFLYILGYSVFRFQQSMQVKKTWCNMGVEISIYAIIGVASALIGLILCRFGYQQFAYKLMTDYRNPALIISACVLVMLFTKEIHMKSSRVISFIATHVFAVYLITESTDIRTFIWKPVEYANNNFSSVLFVALFITVYVVALIVICAFIDYIRKFIYAKIEQFFYEKIYSKLSK